MLTDDMKRIVNEQRLGFVATVGADGSPSVSPKGTFVVVDDTHIAFAEIRSPNTMRNLRDNPAVEVNFVDPFVRKGYRFKGTATMVERGSEAFAGHLPLFERYGALRDKARQIVIISITRALPLTTPAYDIGSSEAELRAQWTRHFRQLQPHARFED